MATQALGIDIKGVTDIDRFLTLASPARAAAEAVMRSLLHAAGILWWAPDRGHDLHQHLHTAFDSEQIELAVQQQAEADERIQSASVTTAQFGSDLQLRIELVLTQDETKVTLTGTLSALGELINVAIAG